MNIRFTAEGLLSFLLVGLLSSKHLAGSGFSISHFMGHNIQKKIWRLLILSVGVLSAPCLSAFEELKVAASKHSSVATLDPCPPKLGRLSAVTGRLHPGAVSLPPQPKNEITPSRVNETVQEFYQILRKPGPVQVADFSIDIYNTLTQRRPKTQIRELLAGPYKDYVGRYYQAANTVAFAAKAEPYATWTHVSGGSSARNRRRLGTPGKNEFQLDHKFYMSFEPKIEGNTQADRSASVYREIEKFLGALPEIYKRVNVLALAKGVHINLKYPNDLTSFLRHPDSLVIHFDDPALGPDVQRIVSDVLNDRGVGMPARPLRGDFGFDFKVVDENKPNTVALGAAGGSHGETVGRIIAKRMVARQAGLKKFSQQELGQWLENQIREVSRLSPGDAHAELYGQP